MISSTTTYISIKRRVLTPTPQQPRYNSYGQGLTLPTPSSQIPHMRSFPKIHLQSLQFCPCLLPCSSGHQTGKLQFWGLKLPHWPSTGPGGMALTKKGKAQGKEGTQGKGSRSLFQGLSTLAILTFWVGHFFVIEGCPVHSRWFSSSKTPWLLPARWHWYSPSCKSQKYLQTWPNGPTVRGPRVLVENQWTSLSVLDTERYRKKIQNKDLNSDPRALCGRS